MFQMSSKRRGRKNEINVKIFEKLINPDEEVRDSENDMDASALNSSPPRSEDYEMEETTNFEIRISLNVEQSEELK